MLVWDNPGSTGTITPRRCKRCGVVGNKPLPSRLCPKCVKWQEKNSGK